MTSLRSQQHVEKIAIVGGGITGLTAAYYASKRYPSASVTLFESSHRLGGAIESSYVPVGGDSAVVCERGPRTLRASAPRAPVTYDLIQALGLRDSLITVSKQCPTAGIRYILYPDHLVSIPAFNPSLVYRYIASIPAPSTLQARQLARLLYVLATEPLFGGLLRGMLRSIFSSTPRPADVDDESIGSFLARHFDHRLVDNLASAIMNGLYAGDVYRLSVKALLPSLWELETKAEKERRAGRNSFLGVILKSIRGRGYQTNANRLDDMSLAVRSRQREDDLIARLRKGPAGELENNMKGVSVFSFRKGVQELPSALETALGKAENVGIHTGISVQKISHHGNKLALLTSSQNKTTSQVFTHIIATTPYNHLISTVDPEGPPMATVTVMLVTLCFATPFLNHPHRGFGYLIPNSVPAHHNPEHALGIVFDTDAMPDQGSLSFPGLDVHQCKPNRNTKITVVLGGHWWEGRSAATLPTEDEGLWMARRLLRRHLGITEEPVASVATLRRDAIPQYEVGHCERMARLHGLLFDQFAGRLRVAGASYRGIGVHDCVFSAWSVVESLELEGLTGLECFTDSEKKENK